MTLAHIAAAAENNVIGVNNTLPWDIPEDMKFFKDKTRGHIVIMGRKTYESMGQPLPKRLNIVITRQADFNAPADVVVVDTLEKAVAHAKTQTAKYGDEVFIIGGGEIYSASMNIVDTIYLTRIHREYPGHAKYPIVDEKKFVETARRHCEGNPSYTFLTYTRRSS